MAMFGNRKKPPILGGTDANFGDTAENVGFNPMAGGGMDAMGLPPLPERPTGFKHIIGSIGDGLSTMGGGNAIYSQAMAQNKAMQEARNLQMMKMQAAAQKTPDPTTAQRNYEWMKAMGREQEAESFLQATANPQMAVEVTDPVTGERSLRFFDRGGYPAPASPQAQPEPTGASSEANEASYQDAGRILQALGGEGFLDWQRRHGVAVSLSTPDQLNALPSGTVFMTPDGKRKIKP